jgi:hypothetical protein
MSTSQQSPRLAFLVEIGMVRREEEWRGSPVLQEDRGSRDTHDIIGDQKYMKKNHSL